MTDRTDRETPRPDIDLIECIADSLLAPAGIASVLIKEDLLACIDYIRAQDARIAALEAEVQAVRKELIEQVAKMADDRAIEVWIGGYAGDLHRKDELHRFADELHRFADEVRALISAEEVQHD